MICSRHLQSRLVTETIFPSATGRYLFKSKLPECRFSCISPCRPVVSNSAVRVLSNRLYSFTSIDIGQDAKQEFSKQEGSAPEQDQSQRRKKRRPPAAKTSLKQTALEAQRSLGGGQPQKTVPPDEASRNKVI